MNVQFVRWVGRTLSGLPKESWGWWHWSQRSQNPRPLAQSEALGDAQAHPGADRHQLDGPLVFWLCHTLQGTNILTLGKGKTSTQKLPSVGRRYPYTSKRWIPRSSLFILLFWILFGQQYGNHFLGSGIVLAKMRDQNRLPLSELNSSTLKHKGWNIGFILKWHVFLGFFGWLCFCWVSLSQFLGVAAMPCMSSICRTVRGVLLRPKSGAVVPAVESVNLLPYCRRTGKTANGWDRMW